MKLTPALLFAALVAMPVTGFSLDILPKEDPKVEIPPPEKEVSITLASSNEKEIVIRVTNRTAKVFTYSGYSPESPIYNIKERPMGWCGTGVRPQTLKPGESFTFKISRTMFRGMKGDIAEFHVQLAGVTSAAIPLK